MEKYTWMNARQKKLFKEFTELFKFKTLSEVGTFVGVNSPYHSAKQIFSTEAPNRYMLKMVELQKSNNEIISQLRQEIETYKNLKEEIGNISESIELAQKHIRKLVNK